MLRPHAAQEVPPLLAPVQWSLPALAEAATSNRRVRAVALGLAFMAHAAVLYVLAREPDEAMAGGGGQQIDAISVTIVSSKVLELLEPDRAQPSAPAAAASVEANDGAPESTPAAATEQHEEKKEKEEPDKEKEKPQEEPMRAAEAIFEVPKEAQRETKPQSAAAPAAGGASARGDAATPAKASGPAAASAGAVREYARYVSLALSRTKPRGAGRLGTVRIKFIIAADGSLASAEIAKSSGNDKLDDSALDAVRQAKFPVPPAGMSVAQLTYEVPYYLPVKHAPMRP